MNKIFSNKVYKKAFTLAETLVTLTIVGVIAALTIPVLKDHSDEIMYVTSLQKAYSDITAATNILEAKRGDMQFWDWNSDRDPNNVWSGGLNIAPMYKTVMNVVPNVKTKTGASTWTRGLLNGSRDGGSFTYGSAVFATADGMVWSIGHGGYAVGGAALVDTNGPNEPNIIGVDQFGFRLAPDGVHAMGDNVHDSNSAWACTAYVLKHGKMPWLNDTSYENCEDDRILNY